MTFRPTFTTPSRYRYLVAVLATWLAALSSGCQGYRPNLTQNGSLKAGYSQVQFENETLKAKLAKLERLDESRNLLKSNGLNLPLDEENPRMVARADQGRSNNRTTFGQVQPNKAQRRSKYADPEEPSESETAEPDFPANESGGAKTKRKALQPPSFPDDPPTSGEEVPEVSMNDVSTGWRRLGYRDYREMTPEPAGDFKTP